jgi:hypothetical protein
LRRFNFSFTSRTKHSYEIPGIGGPEGYVSFWNRTLKEEEGFERVLAFWPVWVKTKYASVSENVEVKGYHALML